MILAIDIGNTNIVLGCIEQETIRFEARMATDCIKTSDQYCAELKGMLALFDVTPEQIDGCIISSVVPPVMNSVRTAIRKLTGLTPLIVGPGIKTGLHIRMEHPPEVGRDLIVAAGAAGAIDGLLDRMEAELGTPTRVIATGGIAKFVIPLCRREILYDRCLMLKGLRLLYKRNTEHKKPACKQ